VLLDLSSLPSGERYEDRYGRWLDVFRDIAHTPESEQIVVMGAPWSWVPLLNALGAHTFQSSYHFPAADHLAAPVVLGHGGRYMDRSTLEVLCAARPETVDALWKCDWQWDTDRTARMETRERSFVVTCNGSFWRAEVLDFIEKFRDFVPPSRKVVLVPCAADKPYPAKLHQAVLDRMPPDWYLMNVTGVLGLVPQAMWPEMPHYDSGIPNEWRVVQMVRDYFTRFDHTQVIAYVDFYSDPLQVGLALAGQDATLVNPVRFYADYLDLLDPARLAALDAAFKDNT